MVWLDCAARNPRTLPLLLAHDAVLGDAPLAHAAMHA
jgi:hypothetical protein